MVLPNQTLIVTPPELHPLQQEIFDCEERFVVASCGRRFGKTKVGGLKSVFKASQGTDSRVWWIAPTYSIANEGYKTIKQIAGIIPGFTVKESERTVILPNGGEITMKTADEPQTLRGSGLDYVVFDEAAFMKPEVWGIILPALSDRNGKALFLSTPFGQNWFYDLYMNEKYTDNWKSFHAPTTANPYIDLAVIEEARRNLPERVFNQEILAIFEEDGSALFRNVKESAIALMQEPNGDPISIGMDIGQKDDWSVIIASNIKTRQQVFMDRFRHIGFADQLHRLHAVYKKYKPVRCVVESNGSAYFIEEAKKLGMNIHPFTTSNQSKRKIIEALASALENRDYTLLNNEVLISEFQLFTYYLTDKGNVLYQAPAGKKDDIVMASAFSYYGAHYAGGRSYTW